MSLHQSVTGLPSVAPPITGSVNASFDNVFVNRSAAP
jgi:hypothetical protein